MEPVKSIEKGRTPSRCREWERNRRNKFNDALARLGEIVKGICKSKDETKDVESMQYPKIEIVEKAITFLSSCLEETKHLQAEILALQVRIDGKENTKKDASTQVFFGFSRKKKNGSGVKIVMLDKTNQNEATEKAQVASKIIKKSNSESSATKTTQSCVQKKYSKLLPKTNLRDKKGAQENTIVVLPAAPYIFPQRPLLLPTMPPTFVLVDSNLQALNKTPFPVVNRNSGDVTKTTTVNILPISAYSRPLSATKTKKQNAKTKMIKKSIKQSKLTQKVNNDNSNEPTKSCEIAKEKDTEQNDESGFNHNTEKLNKTPETIKTSVIKKLVSEKTTTVINPVVPVVQDQITKTTDSNNIIKGTETITVAKSSKVTDIPKNEDVLKTIETVVEKNAVPLSSSAALQNISEKNDDSKKTCKILQDKEKIMALHKEKENKLPNILDSALCESTVDGGNARLELAEEFLAASPTAAFLMSFPLVSGNRADSPAEEPPTSGQVHHKDNSTRRQEVGAQTVSYFEKNTLSNINVKSLSKTATTADNILRFKQNVNQSIPLRKQTDTKLSNTLVTTSSNENPFLNLSISSLIPSTCPLTDSTFPLDLECSVNKTTPSQPTSYGSSNFFYKTDPFSTVKSTIYSTSSISSGHEFNSFGLYPCAVEKYSSKTKPDLSNVEENLMKIGSSRLTYDIDLGWSHKGFDFVNCTSAPNTFTKDSILNTPSTTYSSSYNHFNPEFHMPLVSTSNKRDTASCKANSSFTETITSLYSQPTSLWSEDINYYTNSNSCKTTKTQNYSAIDHSLSNHKLTTPKHFETKQVPNLAETTNKISNTGVPQEASQKYTKKSPTKAHINWMTSEVRPVQNYVHTPHIVEPKEAHKNSYSQLDHGSKKIYHQEANYFPIAMHNFSSQITQDEVQIWPSARPAGPTEISMEPPPINLPTLIGDLALGPHDKKKIDISNRTGMQGDLQNGSNFLSVTQLMNRTTDNSGPSRYHIPEIDASKSIPVKQNSQIQTTADVSHKVMSRIESHIPHPYYVTHEAKLNNYESMNHYPKTKANKSDKVSKVQKNSYSAEALIRGGTCNPKIPETNTKFPTPMQKYSDFNMPQDTVAQVSHFPPILDYSDNSYTGQQFSATTLYSSTTNTISNSFYTNFMPTSSNLMSGNYSSGPFSGEYIDYNQTTPECNYSNHKYEDLKMRNNPTMFQPDKIPSNYKNPRRESTKHKLECSKKDSNKKYQSKRAKLNSDAEDWNDSSHILWQNKTPTKRHHNLVSEELPFPNYMGNQIAGQYQPDFFNSHLMSSNMQTMGANVDRSLGSFPATSRANFNLSTIFPEITMKVQ